MANSVSPAQPGTWNNAAPTAARAGPGTAASPSPVTGPASSPKPINPAPARVLRVKASTLDVITGPNSFEPHQDVAGTGPIVSKAGPQAFIGFRFNVSLNGDRGCFLAGLLQTCLLTDVHAEYGVSAREPFPHVFRMKAQAPVRDHREPPKTSPGGTPAAAPNPDWYSGHFMAMGFCSPLDLIRVGAGDPSPSPLPPVDVHHPDEFAPKLPTGFIDTAWVQGGDAPGGRFPPTYQDLNTKVPILDPRTGAPLLMRRLTQRHRFVTWAAVRSVRSDPAQASSYEFRHFVTWQIDRQWTVTWANNRPAFASTRNEDKVVERGDGMGSVSPVLVGPDTLDTLQLGFDI